MITITTNLFGDIISNCVLEQNPFKDCKNIYDITQLKLHKASLMNNFSQRKVIVNIFERNYSLMQLSQQALNVNIVQFILSEWQINNIIKINPSIKIQKELLDINNFLPHDRELIYSLLCGVTSDKEIYDFLRQQGIKCSERTIRYRLEQLRKKFDVNTRSLLIAAINAHNLNRYLPDTIFPAGIYSF